MTAEERSSEKLPNSIGILIDRKFEISDKSEKGYVSLFVNTARAFDTVLVVVCFFVILDEELVVGLKIVVNSVAAVIKRIVLIYSDIKIII